MKIEEMDVFKKAHSLVLSIYKITDTFPNSEIFGLTSQMRRASYSIPMNLVEGNARNSVNEYLRFINYSVGSCAELQYQIQLSFDLQYLNETKHFELKNQCEQVYKLLMGVQKKVRLRKGISDEID